MTRKNWITDPRTGAVNIDGIRFDQAPLPPRWHRCRPWTIGPGGYGPIYRCACGSLRFQGLRRWVGKNSRRLYSGDVELTGERLDELAAEAEKGYEIENLRPRKRRAPEATDE